MKLFKKLIFIFLSIGALISCDGMDATYKEFIEEGPIVYYCCPLKLKRA